MSGGGGGGTQNTVSQPWSGQQPYLTQGFQRAEQDVLNRPLSYFPENTYVPFAPETEMALGAQANRALQGNPLNFAAQGQLQDTLGGEYFTNSPGFQNTIQATMDAVRPSIDSTFAGGGRYGSGLHAQALGKGFGQGLAPIYNAERNRQMQAAGMAPGLANQDYQDIAQLGAVGQAREGQAGEALQDSIQRFNFAQQEPTSRLAQYMNLIQGNYGADNTSTMRSDQNPFLQLAGTIAPYAAMGAFMCWVAREVYGPANPKWLDFRRWMLGKAPRWLLKLYIRHGEKFAGWLRRHPRWKPIIRRWMDGRIS